jgi:hypothetical protein
MENQAKAGVGTLKESIKWFVILRSYLKSSSLTGIGRMGGKR